jgi:hypothetical protein
MSNLAIFHRRRLMRPTVFCPSRLRHFHKRPLLRATDFFRAAVPLAIEPPA